MKIIRHLTTLGLIFNVAGCGFVDELFGVRDGIPIPPGRVACNTLAECVAKESVCHTAVECAADGLCVFEDPLDGTAITQQTVGDCTQVVCDGVGNTKTIPASDDIEDDQNPCTLDECMNGMPVHTPQLQIQVDCYTGPIGTKDIGICKGGIRQCDNQGNLIGSCEGEVVPGVEDCEAGMLDEDCDGQVNEEGLACICSPLAMEPCYTGPVGTEGVGICVGGQKTCNIDGLGYGPCVGEQLPGVENCEAGMVDEDCDGLVNEEGLACICSPSVTEACYTGPAGTQDVGICVGGQKTCAVDGLGYGPCVGEVKPNAETCVMSLLDEDCDGLLNEEGADCTCGDGIISAMIGEECDDGGTQDGDICSPSCKEQKVLAIDSGGSSTCALLSGGVVKCWGENDYGQLGLGDVNHRGDQPGEMGENLPAVDLGIGKTSISISVGRTHACALLNDGSVKCWGRNNYGQLGQGDTVNRGDDPNEMGDTLPPIELGAGKSAKSLTAGGEHTCVLLNDNVVKCWGFNSSHGVLGLGLNSDSQPAYFALGDEPGEMINLPTVDLGTGKMATAVSAGERHTCALLNDGSVKCWGNNVYGELGLNNTTDHGRTSTGPNGMGDSLPALDLGSGAIGIALDAGTEHTCVLRSDNRIKCWGWGLKGKLGQNSNENVGDGVGPSIASISTINLGLGMTVNELSAGWLHTCAIRNNGKVKCWGSLYYGQLGLATGITDGGMDVAMGSEPGEMESLAESDLGTGYITIALSAGVNFSCALLTSNRVKCWGRTNVGQLGLEDMINDRGDLPNEMGDNLPFVKLFSNVW